MSDAALPLSSVYTQMGGLSELGRRARSRDPEAVREAARQVEALFLKTLLKSMREASFGDPLFGSDQSRFYRDLFDSQIALHLAARRGIGLADALARELGAAGQPSDPGGDGLRMPERLPRAAFGAIAAPPAAAPGQAARAGDAEPELPADRGGFVARLLPDAERAAARIGVAPELLIAQAALETGWGRAVIRAPDGASSHNLFGVKAGPDWEGPRALKATLEFRDGAMVREWAPFKVYGSYAEGFDDYARLVAESPRYAPARAAAADPGSYIHALAGAGYATDPDYGDKVIGLLDAVRGAQAGRGI